MSQSVAEHLKWGGITEQDVGTIQGLYNGTEKAI